MKADEIRELPLTHENYNLMHTIKVDTLNDMDAMRAYYDWFRRYKQKIKPIICNWLTTTATEWVEMTEERT